MPRCSSNIITYIMVFTEVLKEETKRLHAKTETALISKLKDIKNTDDYIQLLLLYYAFYSPVENNIFKYVNNNCLPGFEGRIKSEIIRGCLRNLGADAYINSSPAVPLINNCTEAFGALYVLEGSTLGGEIIARMLKANKHTNLSNECLTFFTVYGSNTMQMWNSFKGVLNKRFNREEDIKLGVNTANETFSKFRDCILNYKS